MRQRKLFAALALGVAALVVVAASGACQDATQVTLDVSYRGGMCGHGVAIIVGEQAHAAEDRVRSRFYGAQTTACEPNGHVGTLVLTPKDGSSRGAVVVIAGIAHDPSTCNPDNGYAGCIVARRVFSFSEHTQRLLPVVLDFECLDVPCSETSSCKNRNCVSSESTCNGDVCDDFGVLGDGGAAIEDASTSNEASANDAAADAPLEDAAVDALKDAEPSGCKLTHGLCPPYTGAGVPCTGMPPQMSCGWIMDPMSANFSATCMQPTPPPPRFYDQFCSSDRDCIGGLACCSVGQQSQCMSSQQCAPGQHLCIEECDCPPGRTCAVMQPGSNVPPFIRTCSL